MSQFTPRCIIWTERIGVAAFRNANLGQHPAFLSGPSRAMIRSMAVRRSRISATTEFDEGRSASGRPGQRHAERRGDRQLGGDTVGEGELAERVERRPGTGMGSGASADQPSRTARGTCNAAASAATRSAAARVSLAVLLRP